MIERSSRKSVMVMVYWALFFLLVISVPVMAESEGNWEILMGKSSTVSAMHMALLPNNKIIIFDPTDFGSSNVSLPYGECGIDQFLKEDCWARSIEYVEYDFHRNQVRSLEVQTETWCSSGAMAPDAWFAPDGCLIQTGSFKEGDRTVRVFSPSSDFCNSTEIPNRRWYGTNHILPDGRIMVVGGRQQYNNLYPLVHLSPDGNLLIFANGKSILFDHVNKLVVRRYPDMPGYLYSNNPTSASSVLLPLDPGATSDAEVLICGGGGVFSYRGAIRWNFLTASNTCGRLRFMDPDPHWMMDGIPMRSRLMVMAGNMLLLPTGDVFIINGASKGSSHVLYPLLYKPSSPAGPLRFQVLTPSATRRLYHSSGGHVLPDGRVLVTGEAFYPPYLAPHNDIAHRPLITSSPSAMAYGRTFTMRFYLQSLAETISVTLLAPSFTTHSYSSNQRLIRLEITEVVRILDVIYEITATVPRNAAMAPPGFYLLFVVHAGIPSSGKWMQLIMCDKPATSSMESMSKLEPIYMKSMSDLEAMSELEGDHVLYEEGHVSMETSEEGHVPHEEGVSMETCMSELEAMSEEGHVLAVYEEGHVSMETCMSDEGEGVLMCTGEATISNGLGRAAVAGTGLGLLFCVIWVKHISQYLISTRRRRMTPQETAVALAPLLLLLLLLNLF